MDVQTMTGHCETHGEYEGQWIVINGNRRGGHCPHCTEEASRKQEEADAERRAAERTQHLISTCGVPSRFDAATIANYKPPTDRAASIRETCRDYVERFPELAKQGSSMILSGNVGTGKTHLATAVAKGVIKRHQLPSKYTSVSQVMRRIRSSYNAERGEETEAEIIEKLVRVPLLVIDEVGVQLGSNHEYTMLFDILNGRYSELQPTVVVSNLGVKELAGAIGERLVDRLRENGAVLIFDWGSYRGAI